MGIYTEGYVTAIVRHNAPLPVLDAIHCMVGNVEEKDVDWDAPELQAAFLFDEGGRGRSLWSFQARHCDQESVFARQGTGTNGPWYLHARTYIKNYNAELEQFFNWIGPYLRTQKGEFIGYSVHDEFQHTVKVFFALGGLRSFTHARSDV